MAEINCPICNRVLKSPDRNLSFRFYRCYNGKEPIGNNHHFFRSEDQKINNKFVKSAESFFTKNFHIVIDYKSRIVYVTEIKNKKLYPETTISYKEKIIFDLVKNFDSTTEAKIKDYRMLQ